MGQCEIEGEAFCGNSTLLGSPLSVSDTASIWRVADNTATSMSSLKMPVSIYGALYQNDDLVPNLVLHGIPDGE